MDDVGNGYFKCQRCETVGLWRSYRSQAAHLRHCTGPMLFDKFETGRSNKKRQCMEMGATEPTGTQLRRQIKMEIHAGHANGTVRTAHTLAAMPSLQKLAEPWEGNNSTAYNFLDFGGADNDDWEEELDEGNIVGEEQQNHFEEAPTGNQAVSMKHWSNVDFCTVGNVQVPVETSVSTKYALLPGGMVY